MSLRPAARKQLNAGRGRFLTFTQCLPLRGAPIRAMTALGCQRLTFEILPVASSKDTREAVAPHLDKL